MSAVAKLLTLPSTDEPADTSAGAPEVDPFVDLSKLRLDQSFIDRRR